MPARGKLKLPVTLLTRQRCALQAPLRIRQQFLLVAYLVCGADLIGNISHRADGAQRSARLITEEALLQVTMTCPQHRVASAHYEGEPGRTFRERLLRGF